jgi:hypothetical protein
MRISVCAPTTQSARETRQFVEQVRGLGVDEVCLVHDNRWPDDTSDEIAALETELTTVNKQDVASYLFTLLDYYGEKDIFDIPFRQQLRSSLVKANSECRSRPFWTNLGWFYNKAAALATGDVFIFMPSDFLFLFNPSQLRDFIQHRQVDGHFYAKPHAVWMTREEALEGVIRPDMPVSQCFHGFHVMTRPTFDLVGGFTEEYYGRSFADDKMTYLGDRTPGATQFPPDFGVAWCKREQDSVHTYLHGDEWLDLGAMVGSNFRVDTPPVRFP